MTHLPFIVVTYVLGLVVPAVFAITAWRRLVQARRRLAAVDPRVGA